MARFMFSITGFTCGRPSVAMNAPISRLPGKSTPSENAPPSTAKPTPWPVSVNRARNAARPGSSMPGGCSQIGTVGWRSRIRSDTWRK
ncbi:hypothetical protein G6F65_020949 [Rhizopus arrhizus]|nr:hypothetical protein G6F65_020949 [Rhizopus arrhizus]